LRGARAGSNGENPPNVTATGLSAVMLPENTIQSSAKFFGRAGGSNGVKNPMPVWLRVVIV
jgi:hypothetical protein